jgi:hypothetical protein
VARSQNPICRRSVLSVCEYSTGVLDVGGGDALDQRVGHAARLVEAAVARTVGAGTATADLGGTATMSEFTAAVIQSVTDGKRGPQQSADTAPFGRQG